ARSVALLPAGSEYLLVDPAGEVAGGSPVALQDYLPLLPPGAMLEATGPESRELALEPEGERVLATRFEPAGGGAAVLLLEPVAEAAASIDAIRAEEGLTHLERAPAATQPSEDLPAADAGEAPTSAEPVEDRSLSALFDRLADHEELYSELPPEADDPALQAEDPAVET